MDFEKMQQVWQQQPGQRPADTISAEADQQHILSKVKKLQRQLLYTNIFTSLMIIGYAIMFKVFWIKSYGDSVLAKTGMVLLFLGLGLSSLVGWMKNRPWNRVSASLSSKAFLQKSIRGFRLILQSQRVYVPLFFTVFVLGLHLLLFAVMAGNAVWQRILTHVGVTAMFVMIGGLGSYHQKLVYQEKYAPVVQELEAMLQELEQE